jgi:hypothetical protein
LNRWLRIVRNGVSHRSKTRQNQKKSRTVCHTRTFVYNMRGWQANRPNTIIRTHTHTPTQNDLRSKRLGMPTSRPSPSRKLSTQHLASFTFKVRNHLIPGQERSTHDETLHVRVRTWSESRGREDQPGGQQVVPCLPTPRHMHITRRAKGEIR